MYIGDPLSPKRLVKTDLRSHRVDQKLPFGSKSPTERRVDVNGTDYPMNEFMIGPYRSVLAICTVVNDFDLR